MTWKRELAFWTFMGFVGLWFVFGLVSTASFITENWGARVAMERAK